MILKDDQSLPLNKHFFYFFIFVIYLYEVHNNTKEKEIYDDALCSYLHVKIATTFMLY